MPKVPLIALKNFTYATRRLKPDDDFWARNRDDAKILIEILGKARLGRAPAIVEAPPAEVVERAKEAAPKVLETEEAPKAEAVKVAAKPKAGAKARAKKTAKK